MGEFLVPHELPDAPNVLSLDLLEVHDYRRKAFVLHYVLGDDDVRGVAYKCWFAAGFTAKNKDSASVSACALMKDPLVKKAMVELHEEMEKEFKARMKSWVGMAIKAQTVLERYVDTMLNPAAMSASGQAVMLSSNQLVGLGMILDRALGKPVVREEKEIGERLSDAIKRLASNKKPAALPESKPSQCVVEIPPPNGPIPGDL